MKKVIIIGPFGDFGGRELEAGFIASVLKEEYEVKVCSTGRYTHQSQLFQFISFEMMISLNELVCKSNWMLKVLALASCIKSNSFKAHYNYANNHIAKRFFGYRNKILMEVDQLIQTSDYVFIVAALSSIYMKEIVSLSKRYNKPVLFRTTNLIRWYEELEYSKDVYLFIHHSNANASQVQLLNHKYTLIDQCALNEANLLAIAPVANKMTRFLTLARLEPSKKIDVVIKAFLEVKGSDDVLYVIGEGSELPSLKLLVNNEPSVIFTGYVSNDYLHTFFEQVECVIISSSEETGPLTGIEAMAAGRLIISTKTGAMPERLGDLGFWFDGSVGDLQNQINKVKRLDLEKANQISCTVREIYRSKYSKQHIAKEYRDKVQSQLF